MKHARVLGWIASALVVSLFTACAGTSKTAGKAEPGRYIASSSFVTLGEDEAQGIAAMQTLLGREVRRFVLTQALLGEFDRKLDEVISSGKRDQEAYEAIESSRERARMHAARMVREEVNEVLENVYRQIVEQIWQSGMSDDPTGEREERARKMARALFDAIRGQNSFVPGASAELMRATFGDLARKMRSINNEYWRMAKQMPESNPHRSRLLRRLHTLNPALANIAGRSIRPLSERLLEQARAAYVDDADYSALKAEIEEIADGYLAMRDQARADAAGGRSPQSDTVFPSAGASGNLFGRGYPAGVWSMTYDDGPSSEYTPKALANLKALGLKATFFVQGNNVKAMPSLAKAIVADGHEIASHSYSHKSFTVGKKADQPNPALDYSLQVDEARRITESVTGKKITLFRLPYGNGFNVPYVRERLAQRGLIHVYWTVDTLDWQDKNPDSVYARTMKFVQSYGRGIILFHDVHPQSIIASQRVLQWLKEKQKAVCPVSAVVDQLNGKIAKCTQWKP